MIRYAGVFLAVVVAIAAAGRRTYTAEQRQLDAEVRGRLEQMADLKATQVAAWRRERLGDVAAVAADARLMPAVQATLRGSADEGTRRDVLAWMHAIRVSYQYATVALVDAGGRMQLLSGEWLLTPARYANVTREIAADTAVAFHDVDGEGSVRPHLALGVTIRPPHGAALGSILLSIDPSVALYSSILQWPLAVPTSRVMLIEHDLAGAEPGVLMSAPKRVPDSPWCVIARVDAAQALAPLAQTRRHIATVAGMLSVLCAISLGLFWRHQRSTFYRQQYEAEAQRQLLRGHYDYLTRFANDALVLMNQDGRLLEVNDRAVEMYGATRGELLAMNVRELRSPTAMPEFDAQWGSIQARGSLVFETEHQRKDGREFPVEISTRVVHVGAATFRQSTIRDISERKRAEADLAEQDQQRRRAEEALRVSRDRLERVLDAMDEGYWDRNITTGEVHVSPRWYTMRGYLPGEITIDWDSWLAMVHPDDRPAVEAASARVEMGGGAELFGIECRVRCKSGEYIWVSTRGKTIERDAAGRAVRRVGTVVDITERKKLEARFLQAQKLESIGRLAGGVAHDFNNLLTVINGFSDLVIGEMEIGGRHQRHLLAIRQAGERGAALTQQLLAFSRKQIVRPRACGVNRVLADVDGLLRRMAGEDVTVLTHLAASPDHVVADPSQLHQVVMNLVVNARDAMPDGGTISIRTAHMEVDGDASQDVAPGLYVRLSVHDTGVGMDDETRALIFEPFFTTKEPGKGTGLGLSTVYGIVQQSGGFIRVDSARGKGTIFHLYFPAAASDSVDEAVAVPAPSLQSSRPTLLVVDDDEDVRSLLPQLLEATCQVLVAADGAEAVEIVRRTPKLDAILTDLFMPNMEGFEMIGIVREMRPDVRIIAMSGAFGGEFLAGAERAGAHATLKKPFDAATLRRLLAHTLQVFPDLDHQAALPIT